MVITQFVAGPGATTLPVYVFGLIRRGVTPLINSVSVVMLTASIILVLLSLSAHCASASISGEPSADDDDDIDVDSIAKEPVKAEN